MHAPRALVIENLSLTRRDRSDNHPIVNGLHLSVPARGILGLIGPSGCGKSLTCLATDSPSSSTVLSKSMLTSWAPSSALVEGVKMACGSLSACCSPPGSAMPQTSPCF